LRLLLVEAPWEGIWGGPGKVQVFGVDSLAPKEKAGPNGRPSIGHLDLP